MKNPLAPADKRSPFLVIMRDLVRERLNLWRTIRSFATKFWGFEIPRIWATIYVHIFKDVKILE